MPQPPEEKHVFRAQGPGQRGDAAPSGRQVYRAGGAKAPQPIRRAGGAAPKTPPRSGQGQPPAGGSPRRAETQGRTPAPPRAARQRAALPGGVATKQRGAPKLPLYLLGGLFALLLVSLAVWGFAGGRLKELFDGGQAAPGAVSGAVSGAAPAEDAQLAVKAGQDWPAQVGDRLVGQKPQRVVSLSPMVTEALLSLPGHGALCGVTEYCDDRGRGLATVGTPLLPRPEAILELAPEYVLCQTPLADGVKEQLEQGGARVIQLLSPTDLESLRRFYGELGALLNGNETGRAQGQGVIDRLADTLASYDRAAGQKATALLLPDLSGLAATAETAEWALLGQVFRHPLESETGWLAGAGCLADDDPDNDLAEVQAAEPDILLVPDTIAPEQLAEALGGLRAVESGAVVYIDYGLVEAFSPRLIFAVAEAANLAYPELQPAALPAGESGKKP